MRLEILYQGAAGAVLRLLYREFVEDMARPAFSQELTFDLDPEGKAVAVVKGARLVISEADNEGITYIVESGFSR